MARRITWKGNTDEALALLHALREHCSCHVEQGRIVTGYAVFEAYVRVGKWQLFPLRLEPLKTYAGAATSENAEILRHVRQIHAAYLKNAAEQVQAVAPLRGAAAFLFQAIECS